MQQRLAAVFQLRIAFTQIAELLFVQCEVKQRYPKHIGGNAHQRNQSPIDVLRFKSKILRQVACPCQPKQAGYRRHGDAYPHKSVFEAHQHQARQGHDAQPQNLRRGQATGMQADVVNEGKANRQQHMGDTCHAPAAPDVQSAHQRQRRHGPQTDGNLLVRAREKTKAANDQQGNTDIAAQYQMSLTP